MRRVFVDVETTGLKVHEGHRVIEVAAVIYDGFHRKEGGDNVFHHYINPGRPIDPEAAKIHGITDSKVEDAPKFAEIAPKLVEFLRDVEFVAHNAEFDLSFLDAELHKAGQPTASELVSKIVDTVMLAREKFPGQRASLDALAQRYGIDLQERRKLHGALVDAEILAEVFAHLHSGQHEFSLKENSVISSLKPSDEHPAIVLLKPDKAAAKLHDEYMQKLGGASTPQG